MNARPLLATACLLGLLHGTLQAGSVSGAVAYLGDQTGPIKVQAAQTLSGNRALKLDGDGDAVGVPSLLDLSGSEITIQYWFKGNTVQSAVRQQSGGWIVAGWNKLHILSHDGGTAGIAMGDAVNDGQWHHVVLTWKQNTPGGFASYLDGLPVASRASADEPIPNHNAPVYFGSFNGAGEFAEGLLDEIAIWRRALTAEEVAATWNQRLGGSEADLVGYWGFDDQTANDASPNGFHGEFFGDASIVDEEIPGLGAGLGTTELAAPGAYTIAGLPNGAGYAVTAFCDVNGNGAQDPSEPAGAYVGNPLTVSGDQAGIDITLVEPPRMIQQPVDLRVAAGGDVVLSVQAQGTLPLTFQWRKYDVDLANGGRVSGAQSAELRISSAQSSDAGIYTVVIANAVGSVTSSPAAVEVVANGANVSGTIAYGGIRSGSVYVTVAQRPTDNLVLNLDGNGDFAATTLTDLSGPELTVQFWFRGSESQSAIRQQGSGWIVSTWNNLHILNNDRGTTGISAGASIEDGNWHHVVMTWKQNSPGGFASYLDGKPVASRDSTDTPVPDYMAQLYFGSFNGTAEFTRGQLDEIAVWRRSFTASEIAANWRSGLTGTEDGLAGYWNFDDSMGYDLSVYGNHAELHGDAAIVGADVPMGRAYTEAFVGPGAYALTAVPRDTGYSVSAFLDANDNGLWDAGEPLGEYSGNPFDLTANKSGVDVQLFDPPVIGTQPGGVRSTAGSTVTFAVDAAGTAPLTYQWQFNGADLADGGKISGATTPELTLTGIGDSEAGVYSVVVRNQAGTATSVGAVLVLASGMTDGLLAHWKLDDQSGFMAADATGQGLDAELFNYTEEPEWGPGIISGALEFGGPELGHYGRVPDYPKPISTMAVSAWVFADTRPTWASVLKNWGGSAAGQFHFGLDADNGRLSNYLTMADGASVSAADPVQLPLGIWQHVAFVADGSRLVLYRNGLEVAATPYDGTLYSPPMPGLGLGAKLDNNSEAVDTGSPGYWDGELDDIGLWGRALIPDEVYGIYLAGMAGKDLTQAVPSRPVPADVTLSITRVDGGLVITWPENAAGFTLESSAGLPAIEWSPVEGVVNQRVVISPSGAAQFYRLRHP